MANHLPSIDTNILDTGQRTDSLISVNKSLNIIGYSSNDTTSALGNLSLPVNEPYQVVSIPTARTLTFNHDGTESELTEALDEALATGLTNIYLTRMGQVYSYEEKFCNVVTSAGHQVTAFSSASGDVAAFTSATLLDYENRYDALDATLTILETTQFDVLAPIGAYQDKSTASGTKDFGYRVALHCYKVTKEFNACHAVIPVKTALHYAYESDATINYRTGIPTLTQLTAWSNYLINASATNYGTNNFDPIAPRTTSTSFFLSTETGTPTNHAWFLNTSETAVPTLYSAATVAKDAHGVPIDLGRYVTVVAANCRFRNATSSSLYPTYGYYNKNPYVYIAAQMAAMESGETLTNSSTTLELQDSLRTSIANTLSGFGFLTIFSLNGSNSFSYDNTGAYHVSPYSRSDYDDGFINREVDNIVRDLNTTLQPKLGKSKLIMIEQAARGVIQSYVESGILKSGTVNATKTVVASAVGHVTLALKLNFISRVNAITLNVSIGIEL